MNKKGGIFRRVTLLRCKENNVTDRINTANVMHDYLVRPQDKPYKLYDEGGLLLLVRPTGTKVWQLPYKFNGKYNIHTIREYGSTADTISTAEARKRRDGAKALLKQCIDPNTQRKTERQRKVAEGANMFETVARDWHSKQKWTAKHGKNILSRLEKDVFGIIGWKPIAEVNVPDVMTTRTYEC